MISPILSKIKCYDFLKRCKDVQLQTSHTYVQANTFFNGSVISVMAMLLILWAFSTVQINVNNGE